MKACRDCGDQKPLAEYYKDIREKDGHIQRCKVCMREASRLWREQRADHHKALSKARYEANKARYQAAGKDYRQANRTRIQALNKARYEANRARIQALNKARYEANRARYQAANKAHYEINKAQVAAYKRQLVDTVAPSYAATNLRMPVAEVSPELLQTVRDKIALRRLAQLLKEASNENQ